MKKEHAKIALSPMEWTIMNAAWKHCESTPDFTVSELVASFPAKKWTISTVKTVLERLVKKGALTGVMRGHTSFYRPAVARDQVVHENVARFLDNVLDGAFGPLVAYLADRRSLDQKQIAELEKLLKDHQQK